MIRRNQLFLIILIVASIASLVSHVAVRSLGIRYRYGGQHHYGPNDKPERTILHGSSLAYSALDWDRVSEKYEGPIHSWAVPGSSPAEWEMNHRRSPQVTRTFIVLSVYDLNEYILCDFRADIVPFSQAVGDLRRSDADWPFVKRILSQYPERILRKIFPTVGRSDAVMTGIRDMFRAMMRGPQGGESREGVAFGPTGMSEVKERMTDWTPARLNRRLVLMRSACQERHKFDGPKRMALRRLVQKADNQGAITFIVVPVSPLYQKEFLTGEVSNAFEATLAEIRQLSPSSSMIRLDQLPSLQDNSLFSDLVHMNLYGQRIASAAFLGGADSRHP